MNASETVRRDLRRVVVDGIRLHRVRDQLGPADLELMLEAEGEIRRYITALVELWTTVAPDWSSDFANPGYLVFREGQESLFRVPWTLLDDFPDRAVASELASVARSIRLDPASAICLGGSAAMSAEVGWFGDLDFCEYVAADPGSGGRRDAREALAARMLAERSGVICHRVKISSGASGALFERWRPWPWRASPRSDPEFERAAGSFTSGQLAFLAKMTLGGPVEVTDLQLVIDPEAADAGTALMSFAFQEAPLVDERGWAPRRLDAMAELSRYIDWLVQQADRHLEAGEVTKGAKRALSLARLLGLRQLARTLLRALRERKQGVAAALEARLHLRDQILATPGADTDRRLSEFCVEIHSFLAKAIRVEFGDDSGIPSEEPAADYCSRASIYLRERHLQGAGALLAPLGRALRRLGRILQSRAV